MASGAKTSNTVEIFSYIARDQKSGVVKGEIKALEERVVQEQLKKMGLDPISITIKKVSMFENLDILNNLVCVRSNFCTLVRCFTLNCYAITPDNPGISVASILIQGFIDHHDNSCVFVVVLVLGYVFR